MIKDLLRISIVLTCLLLVTGCGKKSSPKPVDGSYYPQVYPKE